MDIPTEDENENENENEIVFRKYKRGVGKKQSLAKLWWQQI